MDKIGVCGDNCTHCPRYTATQKGGTNSLQEVKALWVRLGLRDPEFPVQNMACSGCTPENNCAYPQIRDCAAEKKVANCGVCTRYPCSRIYDVFERTEKFRSEATAVCTPEEVEILEKAFFWKKQYLNQMKDI